MKFKTIFLIFNAVVLLSFLFVFFAPLLVLDASYARAFMSRNWFLALSFAAILGALNFFFAKNWKLFSLLEREDWPALSAHLGREINEKGRASSRNVKVYVNSLLLLSDLEGIERLEAFLAEKKPRALARHALLFGVAKLLRGEYGKARDFLASFRGNKSCEDADWIAFDEAFAALALKDWPAALPLLEPLAQSRDPVLKGLSAFYLDVLSSRLSGADAGRAGSAAAAAKAEILKRRKRKAWEAAAEEAKADVKGVILSKMMEDAASWLYGKTDENAR